VVGGGGGVAEIVRVRLFGSRMNEGEK